MSGRSSRDDWIERVLGVAIKGGGANAQAAPDFSARLARIATAFQVLQGFDPPELADLTAQRVAAETAAASGSSDAARRIAALEKALVRAISAGRGRDAAQANPRSIVYRKMLLRWREAQSRVSANLAAVGKAMLSLPEVQADPRFSQVEQAVARLPGLVPDFGGALEDVLDAALSTAEPTQTAGLARRGVAAIDTYRARLASATQLLALEAFAAADLGRGVALHAALDEALGELRQEFSAQG